MVNKRISELMDSPRTDDALMEIARRRSTDQKMKFAIKINKLLQKTHLPKFQMPALPFDLDGFLQ